MNTLRVSPKVKDIMTRDVVAVRPDTSVAEIARLLTTHRIGGVPVVDGRDALLPIQEVNHRTLFSVIEDETVLKRVTAATQTVVGNFSRHHTGLLFVVPVALVLGLERTGPE